MSSELSPFSKIPYQIVLKILEEFFTYNLDVYNKEKKFDSVDYFGRFKMDSTRKPFQIFHNFFEERNLIGGTYCSMLPLRDYLVIVGRTDKFQFDYYVFKNGKISKKYSERILIHLIIPHKPWDLEEFPRKPWDLEELNKIKDKGYKYIKFVKDLKVTKEVFDYINPKNVKLEEGGMKKEKKEEEKYRVLQKNFTIELFPTELDVVF